MTFTASHGIDPERHGLLSNGSYGVLLDSTGAGWSRWRGRAVTRWREDPTCNPWGTYLFLRDEESGAVWSATQQPFGTRTPDDAVEFTPGRVRYVRRHHSVHSVLDVAVGADADLELRQITVSNHGDQHRRLSLTSYAELVLGPIGADDAHPAFSKMFVTTEWDPTQALLLATRRRRDPDEAPMWAAFALQVAGRPVDGTGTCESDRARFLGRCRTLRDAFALQPGVELSGTVGCVLDPVCSLRQRFALAPRESVTLWLWTRVADSRDGALALNHQLANGDSAAALLAAAPARARARRGRHGLDADQAARCDHWLAALVGSGAAQRAPAADLARGRGGAPTLWAQGISGDRPIVLVRVANAAALGRVRDVLQAQRYWQDQYLAADVVLLDTEDGAAAGAVQAALVPLVDAQRAALAADAGRPKAEVFALRGDAIDAGLRAGLLTCARIVLDADTDAAAAAAAPPVAAVTATAGPAAAPVRATRAATPRPAEADAAPEFANGLGGFVDRGRSYRIELKDGATTPAPWINVIANPAFGFIVSAEGGGYTWSLNSQQNPLTPWPNDAVSDLPHEVLYLRDEDTGVLWSATAAPIRVPGTTYTATHGKGWTRFAHAAHGIALELVQCVPVDDAVKLSRLRLANHSSRPRHLAITGYVDWALGANGTTPAPFVVTARDAATGALFARNAWRADFTDRVAFIDLGGMQQSMSGSRRELLGALGSVAQPAGLHAHDLSGSVGAGLDPCGALQTHVVLPPQTQLDVVFMLGDAPDESAAQALVAKYRAADFDAVLAAVGAQWADVLDCVQVQTPDRALDVLVNDWLLYQVASCRLWARTAGYQASGAYGFRDQLQDVMALVVARPDLAREHLLRAAGRQFAEGDVQHWWLPPGGRGIRTKIRDDRIWLAYVAMHYVATTGDAAVLEEPVAFLTGPAIADGASDAFFQPGTDPTPVSLYEHCARGIDSSLAVGAHGLPLVGTGDWNDGMNAVGAGGRGESTWLAWFLAAAIAALAPVAQARGDADRAQRWRDHAEAVCAAAEQAWDGQWYRRGYYDDGTPLGSSASEECWIDTIAQSWSLMTHGAPGRHAREAMAAVDRLLVDHPHQVARLFTPPFDHSRENPGYIKGYPPGVRENGGQYTHGATWSVFAWAALGDGDRAADVFNILDPIRHADSPAAVARYKVEPYVACADVYSVAPHIGRGGWTWYTGSAAWLYRAALEALLGFHPRGDRLLVDPCIPAAWPGFQVTWRRPGAHGSTTYVVHVDNPRHVCRGVARLTLDGAALATPDGVPLADDGATHAIVVTLGQRAAQPPP